MATRAHTWAHKHSHPHGHTHAHTHSHTCTHIACEHDAPTHIYTHGHVCLRTHAHQQLPLLSPDVSRPGGVERVVGMVPGQNPIAQHQGRWVSTVRARLPEPTGPRNPACVGHGLLILLEKLGLCQVPLLRFFLELVGSHPAKVLSLGVHRPSAPPGALQNQRPPWLPSGPLMPTRSPWPVG